MWLRRHFVAFVIVFAALCTIAEANLPRAETSHIEEPCGIALIGACLPRKVVAWERTQGTIVENVRGFTLLEIAIVLMVIGLIVGGILWGAEMIGQAAAQAQITQIQKYDSAANTFYVKYGYLPGDIPDPYASQFGFQARGAYAGEGDGNGVLEGIANNAANNDEGIRQGAGETEMFWVDLSAAKLIDGNFTLGSPTTCVAAGILPNAVNPPQNAKFYFPAAKIGNGNFVFVYSNGYPAKPPNYFNIAAFTSIDGACGITGLPRISVKQAYMIDKKIDDGLPQSGVVKAKYISYAVTYGFDSWAGVAPGTAVSGSVDTCYDNGGNASNPMQYSMEVNNGANVNCALSFKMQGAAR